MSCSILLASARGTGFAVLAAAVTLRRDPNTFWSPYYRIDLRPYTAPVGWSKPPAYELEVNHDFHQHTLDLSEEFVARYPQFEPNRSPCFGAVVGGSLENTVIGGTAWLGVLAIAPAGQLLGQPAYSKLLDSGSLLRQARESAGRLRNSRITAGRASPLSVRGKGGG